MSQAFVILGGGLAGSNAVSTLRGDGFDGPIVLVGEERHLPYDRPPLSKEYVRGEMEQEKLALRSPSWYAENEVEVRLGTPAQRVDPSRKLVHLERGAEIAYDKLLVATGGRPRRLGVPGENLDGVFYLRTLEDSGRIKRAMESGMRLGIVGGGFIGSELAASARKLGLQVTVLEALEAPLERTLGREMGEVCAAIHRDEGVELRTGDAVAAFEGRGRVQRLRTSTGDLVDCDLAAVGVGIVPNVEPLAATGAELSSGVVVDEYCQSSVEGIYAAGDVARHHHPLFGLVRVEHWQNARQQGAAAARSMLGSGKPYAPVHWFWSDQYAHNMQYAGCAAIWDEIVVRGDVADRSLLAFFIAGGRLKAAFALNRGKEMRSAMKIIESSATVEPAQLGDDDVDLRALVAKPAGRRVATQASRR